MTGIAAIFGVYKITKRDYNCSTIHKNHKFFITATNNSKVTRTVHLIGLFIGKQSDNIKITYIINIFNVNRIKSRVNLNHKCIKSYNNFPKIKLLSSNKFIDMNTTYQLAPVKYTKSFNLKGYESYEITIKDPEIIKSIYSKFKTKHKAKNLINKNSKLPLVAIFSDNQNHIFSSVCIVKNNQLNHFIKTH